MTGAKHEGLKADSILVAAISGPFLYGPLPAVPAKAAGPSPVSRTIQLTFFPALTESYIMSAADLLPPKIVTFSQSKIGLNYYTILSLKGLLSFPRIPSSPSIVNIPILTASGI